MNIKWIILDVDGVLTDGKLIYTSSGEEIKAFSARDGLGLAAAHKAGISLGIITARTSPMGHANKTEALRSLCESHHIELAHIAYMGDDLNDLGALSLVGLPMAPQDAAAEVKELAQFVSNHNGGSGAVRDAVEYILKAQNMWDSVVKDYAMEAHNHGQ